VVGYLADFRQATLPQIDLDLSGLGREFTEA
jgi:hypothetical protein